MRAALRDLVAAGLVASDGFGGLRSIIRSSTGRPGPAGRRSSIAGRWSLLRDAEAGSDIAVGDRAAGPDAAQALRRRLPAPAGARSERRAVARAGAGLSTARGARRDSWRTLRRRHVRANSSRSATPSSACAKFAARRRTAAAWRSARPIRSTSPASSPPASACGPSRRTGCVYRDGVPIAALEGEYVRPLAEVDPAIASDAARALTGNPALSVVSGFVGR